MTRQTSQCSGCGKEAGHRELGGLRLCADCREEKFQAALKAWLNGMTASRAAERYGLTKAAFGAMTQKRGIRLKNTPHRKRRRSKAQRELYRKASVSRAQRDFLDQPLPIDRQCTKCRKVKIADEFYVYKGRTYGPNGQRSLRLSARCRKCHTAIVRKREKALDPEILRARKRTAERRWREKAGLEKLGEIASFKREKKLHEQGKERAYAKHPLGKKSQSYQTDVKVPIGPFQAWIERRCDYYAQFADVEKDGYRMGLTPLAKACGISDRTLRRILDGSEIVSKGERKGERRTLEVLPLHTVDSCLTREGTGLLQDLYSEDDYLYPEATELLEVA